MMRCVRGRSLFSGPCARVRQLPFGHPTQALQNLMCVSYNKGLVITQLPLPRNIGRQVFLAVVA